MYNKDELIKELYNIRLTYGPLDGGEYLESTPIYRELETLVSPLKPSEKNACKYFPFECALAALAFEFYRGDDYGIWMANSYSHLTEDRLINTNFDYLVKLLKYFTDLDDFKEDDLDYNYEQGIVTDRKTGQMLSADNVQKLLKSILELHLDIQIERIKIHLCEKQNRDRIIRFLAGSDKEERLESAEFRFNRILNL